MVLKVNIKLILPLSTQLGSASLSHSGFLSFLHTPYITHLLFRTTKGNGRLFLIVTKALCGPAVALLLKPSAWLPASVIGLLPLSPPWSPASMSDLLQSILHKAARLFFLKYKLDPITSQLPCFKSSNSFLSLWPDSASLFRLIFQAFPLLEPHWPPFCSQIHQAHFDPRSFALTVSLLAELFPRLSHYCLLLSLQISTQMSPRSHIPPQVPSTILPYFVFFIALSSWNYIICLFKCLLPISPSLGVQPPWTGTWFAFFSTVFLH